MFENKRILIVDDNESIHDDFKKILLNNSAVEDDEYLDLEKELFDIDLPLPPSTNFNYQIDSAYQGQEAFFLVEKADAEGNPYWLIFVDVRMPPGLDGIDTISKIWQKYPLIEMVICSAYSDYSWEKIIEKLGINDKILFLKKPFDAVEVQQMVLSLTKKFYLSQKINSYVGSLEKDIAERTKQVKSMVQELVNHRDKLKMEVLARQKLEDLMNREKIILTTVSENISEGVIVTDNKGKIFLINQKARIVLLDFTDSTEKLFLSNDQGLIIDDYENYFSDSATKNVQFFSKQTGKKIHLPVRCFCLKEDLICFILDL